MIWRRKRKELPAQLELEQWKQGVVRETRFYGFGGLLVGLGGLLVAYVAQGRDIPVITLDAEGRPTLHRSGEAAKWRTDPMRVKYFALEFTRRWESVNSANMDEDLLAVMHMMSLPLRVRRQRDETTFAARKAYKNQGIRTVFSDMDTTVAAFNADDEHAPIAVTVIGKKTFKAEFGKPPLRQERSQWFYIALKLNSFRPSEEAIFGLEVSEFFSKVADTREELKALLSEPEV